MELREDSKLALTMKWGLTDYDYQIGWTIDGKYASEDEVIELVSMAYNQHDLEIVAQAIDFCKKNWKLTISKDKRMKMNKTFIEFESALINDEDMTAFKVNEESKNGGLYCLLGHLYNNKGDVSFANYWYQKATMLGHPEGEGMLGLSYHFGYGVTGEDINDNDIDIAVHMLSADLSLFWLNKAQKDGWKEATRYIDMVKEGIKDKGKRKKRTKDEMIEAAINGMGPEQMDLAVAYENGDEEKGISIDYEEAVRWYNKALYSILVPRENVCKIIADILENKIKDKKRALTYYRKAYLLDDLIRTKNEKTVLAEKIKKLTMELYPDRDEKIKALQDYLEQDDFSDAALKELAEIMEYVQESIYEEPRDEEEKEMLLRRIPKARAIIDAAFAGRAVAENAIGVFYHRGILLPLNLERAEYWFRCAYTDGYDTAYDNLHLVFSLKGDKKSLENLVIIAARDGVECAKQECDDLKIDCMEIGPREHEALRLYPDSSLKYHDATPDEIELIEQLFIIDDVRRKKGILHRLVPATTDEYMNAFLTGKPMEYSLIDKLMDTDNLQERMNIIKKDGVDVDMDVLENVPYMPLDDLEKKFLIKWGYIKHRRSSYRGYDYSNRWNKLTDKEKTVIKIMDADHRLSFDLANYIVDEYVKRLEEDKQTKCETIAAENKKFDDFWLDYGNDSRYVKRQAYAHLKLNHKEITEKSLRQEGANLVLNHINMSINPIMAPLVSLAASLTFEQIVESYKSKE